VSVVFKENRGGIVLYVHVQRQHCDVKNGTLFIFIHLYSALLSIIQLYSALLSIIQLY